MPGERLIPLKGPLKAPQQRRHVDIHIHLCLDNRTHVLIRLQQMRSLQLLHHSVPHAVLPGDHPPGRSMTET